MTERTPLLQVFPIQPYARARERRLAPGLPELADQGVDLGRVQARVEGGRRRGRCGLTRVDLEDDIRGRSCCRHGR